MQVVSTRTAASLDPGLRGDFNAKSYLSLYQECPEAEISLDDFEQLAVNRLVLLRAIEAQRIKGNTGSRELQEFERKYMPLKTAEDAEKDRASHFILRLAYCRTEDLRNWFLAQECALLRCRLDALGEAEIARFMVAQGLVYERVEAGELAAGEGELRSHLLGLLRTSEASNFAANKFYKVPFQQALPLIASREVYLKDGFAYVPLQRLVATLLSRYRMMLSRALAEAASKFELVAEDGRIGPVLRNMNRQHVGSDFSQQQQAGGGERLTAAGLQSGAAVTHMPLCMRHLHGNLRREHKLKHWGRLQYGLFLKGAGLDLEQAQLFWEAMFTKVMSHEDFVKKYAYSFRHMYGKEGARRNYTPFSCLKIIMGSPPEIGAYHGCPYRHAGEQQLAALVGSLKLGDAGDAGEVQRLAREGHYQLACARHFDAAHPGHAAMNINTSDGVASHPNQWFQASREYERVKNGLGDAPAASTASAEGTAMELAATTDTPSTNTGGYGATGGGAVDEQQAVADPSSMQE